jgi:hypothetical protein
MMWHKARAQPSQSVKVNGVGRWHPKSVTAEKVGQPVVQVLQTASSL